MSDPIVIYTDGSCKGNPGSGGWAAVFPNQFVEDKSWTLHAGEAYTTNNRMELTAVIKGLDATPWSAHVVIYSDSTYVVNTMTKGWKRRANHDLWEQLDAVTRGRNVRWCWVKAHSGVPGNEAADRLAQEEAERWRLRTRDRQV